MENLTEKVYECTLGVEAHMICDLLARAGISARVDGEFLQGAGGELPIGSSIKVRVAPQNAVEARAVIDEWEKLQPPADPTPPPRRPSWVAPVWFIVGFLVGGALVAALLRSPVRHDGIDYDGDGRDEVTYIFNGGTQSATELDRNGDGKTDARWEFDLAGREKTFSGDDDFDGRFEWQMEMEKGEQRIGRADRDGNGKTDEIWYLEHGVVASVEYLDESGVRILSRQRYAHGVRASAEFDRDRDGVFEQRVEIDRFGMPK